MIAPSSEQVALTRGRFSIVEYLEISMLNGGWMGVRTVNNAGSNIVSYFLNSVRMLSKVFASTVTWVVGHYDSSAINQSGPLNHLPLRSSWKEHPREPISAGLSLVGRYLTSRYFVAFNSFSRFSTKTVRILWVRSHINTHFESVHRILRRYVISSPWRDSEWVCFRSLWLDVQVWECWRFSTV